MADTDNSGSSGPITNVTLNNDTVARDQNQPIEQVRPPVPEPIDPSNQVTIKAIRTFQGVEGFKNPQSEPFIVSRQRAADLFANGLIEFVDEADEDATIQADADARVAAAKAAANARRTKK